MACLTTKVQYLGRHSHRENPSASFALQVARHPDDLRICCRTAESGLARRDAAAHRHRPSRRGPTLEERPRRHAIRAWSSRSGSAGSVGSPSRITITGAGGRFDIRRQQIVEESNAICDAYRRLDVLPAATHPALRRAFRDYVDSRLAVYRNLPDIRAAKRELAVVSTLQDEIWTQAVAAVRADGALPYAASLVLPGLNAMFD